MFLLVHYFKYLDATHKGDVGRYGRVGRELSWWQNTFDVNKNGDDVGGEMVVQPSVITIYFGLWRKRTPSTTLFMEGGDVLIYMLRGKLDSSWTMLHVVPHPSHICSIPHMKKKKCDVRGHLAVFIWENDYKDASDGCWKWTARPASALCDLVFLAIWNIQFCKQHLDIKPALWLIRTLHKLIILFVCCNKW